jgi:hypothetical protein
MKNTLYVYKNIVTIVPYMMEKLTIKNLRHKKKFIRIIYIIFTTSAEIHAQIHGGAT